MIEQNLARNHGQATSLDLNSGGRYVFIREEAIVAHWSNARTTNKANMSGRMLHV
jgi:hypothetical protein